MPLSRDTNAINGLNLLIPSPIEELVTNMESCQFFKGESADNTLNQPITSKTNQFMFQKSVLISLISNTALTRPFQINRNAARSAD